MFSYIYICFRNAGLISRSWRLEFMNSSVFNMLHLYFLIINAQITKHARFYAFSLLINTLSWFSSPSFIKLYISSGIFSASSNNTYFSSSYQLRVKYYTPMLSQWLLSCIPAVFTIFETLFEIMNSKSWAPYSSQINKPSFIFMTPTRFSSSTSSCYYCYYGMMCFY